MPLLQAALAPNPGRAAVGGDSEEQSPEPELLASTSTEEPVPSADSTLSRRWQSTWLGSLAALHGRDLAGLWHCYQRLVIAKPKVRISSGRPKWHLNHPKKPGYTLPSLQDRAQSAPSHSNQAFAGPARWPPARPNPSLKRSSNGMAPGPGHRYGVHSLWPGPGTMPLGPA